MKKFLALLIIICVNMLYFIPAFADTQDEYIKINRDYKHMGSRMHKEYKGCIYKITNISDQQIEIAGISLEDNLTSDAAYSTIKRSSIGQGLKIIGTGLAFALPTLTISLIGSVVVAPFAMISNSIGNIGAKQDAKRYDKKIEKAILSSGESAELKTIITKHKAPSITVFYKVANDLETKELKD